MNDKEEDSLSELLDDRSEANVAALLDDSDADSLSLAKANWYLGEWDELSKIDLNQQKNHADLGVLALLKASGYQQLGQIENCRKSIEIAKLQNCDRKLMSKILITGLQNSLGKITAIQGRTETAKQYFLDSVSIGNSENAASVGSHTRTVKQLASLGLIPELEKFIETEASNPNILSSEQLEKAQINYEALKAYATGGVSLTASTTAKRPKKIHLQELLKQGKDVDLVVAGMRHSGSTALFNILRLALGSLGIPLESGYSEAKWLQKLKREQQLRLIKTHEVRDDLISGESIVITTTRDLRDTVASASRRGYSLFSKLGPVEYAKYNRALHDVWSEKSNYSFDYERFLANPEGTVSALLEFLGIRTVDVRVVIAQVATLETDNYEETLLSPTHITDPERVLSYTDSLSQEGIKKITQQNYKWLLMHGYV